MSGLRVAAPLYYEDAVRRALLDFKFKGRMGGLPCFGSLMARCAAEEFGGEFDAITWVPVSRKRLRRRGFDQARYLAGSLCVEWHVEPQETLRKTNGQPGPVRPGRCRRPPGQCPGRIRGCPSGEHRREALPADRRHLYHRATLSEAARVLRQAGAADVVGLTLAISREE